MIDELTISASKKEIYEKLKKIYKPNFSNDYKLIVYYNEDIINNINFQGKFLENFISILVEIDFPTFFVTIKSNYENLLRDLKHLNSIYKNGIVNIDESSQPFTILKESKNTFCVYPWMHFYFDPQGQINACCSADINYPLGDYKNDVIDFNSPNIKKFRQTLINNEMAPQCSSCYKKEDLGLVSNRIAANKRFSNYIPANPEATIENFKLRFLDIRLSNLCNLKCRMCSGNLSSKIAAEDFKIWGDTRFLYNSNNKICEQKLLELCKDQINNIETIYFAGGEPLLSDFHYLLLNLLIENNRTNVKIEYNTNFTKIDQVLDYWSNFTNVTVGASIDLCGPAANYVRNGVEYDVIKSNYFKLAETHKHINFTITSVLSLYNVFNLCDLQLEWLSSIGLSQNNLSVKILTNPDNMSITVLPYELKQKAQQRIENHIEYLTKLNANNLIHQWQEAINLMNNVDNSHLLKSFFVDNDIRDKIRNQNFENYFPEFKNLRQYIDV